MKYDLILAVGVLALPGSARAGVPQDWSDIRGCYDTIQYDGQPVGGAYPENLSLVNYAGTEGLMLNPDMKPRST